LHLSLARNELDRQKEAMLAKGLNPYTEFRKRDFEEADVRLEKSLKDAVAQNKVSLAERLLKEEEDYRSEEAELKKERVKISVNAHYLNKLTVYHSNVGV
jgi:hypothetical protein